jgi:hypothetical protein
MKIFVLAISCLFLFTDCHKTADRDNPCNTPVAAILFTFLISDSNSNDIFSQKYLGNFPFDSVQIYHIDKSGIHKDTISIEKDPYMQNRYGISSNTVLNNSIAGIKTFYFRRKSNITDTIYFDETRQTEAGGCFDYQLHAFKYNGVSLITSTVGDYRVVVKP